MNKKIYAGLNAIIAGVVFLASAALPASAAQVTSAANVSITAKAGVSTTVNTALTTKVSNITSRADQEIARRVKALNALTVRVNAMQKLSTSDKANISTSIQNQLNEMAALQSKIAADAAANSTSSLKADVQSITVSYRIFALVLPQGAIEAASDRVLTTAAIMADLSTKLSARGATSSQLTDLSAKVADANTQATAAASEVAVLQPDGGNATIKASNTATLKDARAKIVAAQQDLIAARADAEAILKTLNIPVSASTSATATTSVQ